MTIGRIIDVSSNNHPNGAAIGWRAVKAAGVTTAIVKATEDVGYTNPYFDSDIAGARGAGLDVLAYHFAGTSPPAAQAGHFLNVAGRLARILDIETQRNVPFCRTFLAALGLGPDQCLTYGSSSSLVDIYQQLPSMAWPAAYGQGYPGWGVLWQFTDAATIPGISGPVDENQWHGSEVQYETLFGLLEPTQEEKMLVSVTSTGGGYWCVKKDGSVYAYGDAVYKGGVNNAGPNGSSAMIPGDFATGVSSHGTDGYVITTDQGEVYAFGSVPYKGHP